MNKDVTESALGEVDYGFTSSQEMKLILLLGSIQFINILDFMMVMPMGPDFSTALAIDPAHLAWIGGSYTAAAACSGLAGSFILDRFDRKSALSLCLAGLAFATVLGGFATSFPTLLAARVVAGLFGGPTSSLTFAMAVDAVPVARRGRAMGALMSAYSIASVFGVPAGLELARLGGWRMPFFAVGAAGFLVLALIMRGLPQMRAHIARAKLDKMGEATRSLFSRRNVLLSFGSVMVAMCSGFMLIPNLATYFQFNLGLPRDKLGSLYLFGGLISFSLMILSGRMIDKFNAVVVGGVATVVLLLVSFFGFVIFPTPVPVYLLFIGFMAAMGSRSVASTSVASRVPAAHERARFVSFMSVFQNAASAIGAFLSASMLRVGSDGRLLGMDHVALTSMACSACVMVFMVPLERNLDRESPRVKKVGT